MKKIYTLITVTALAITACTTNQTPVQVGQNLENTNTGNTETVSCQKDLRICPDGTRLSRVAPDCKFPDCPQSTWQKISSNNISGIASVYDFTAEIPNGWLIEVVPAIEAINIYNPNAAGENNLEKSQIFIRHFEANSFLTLSTVTIHDKISTTISGRPAVIYDIEKKSGVANFANQPLWRSQRHFVTDIRSTDQNPTTFYVLGRNPNLDQETWDHFLNSLKFSQEVSNNTINYSADSVTKKPFGIYITPQNSPVSPERFSGYHTGTDFEYDTDQEIKVTSLADGEIVLSSTVSGYGGVIVVKQNIKGTNYFVVYGHLDPKSLMPGGTKVTKGEILGVLGEGYSSETDNERKHLHLGLYKGDKINLKGYVQSEEELKMWDNALEVL